MIKKILLAALFGVWTLPVGTAEPVDYINTLIGTIPHHGKVFPGAATPFGLVQLSPDTYTGGDLGCGYAFNHDSIEGFSFTHMSGVGAYGDLGNLLVTPATGPLLTDKGWLKSEHRKEPGYRSTFSHETEVAKSGYYAVTLDDHQIRAEMTATPHAGILRFTFPKHEQARIQLDLARRVGGTSVRQFFRVVDDNTIAGWMRCTPEGGGWCNGAGKPNYTAYFYGKFSRPLKSYGAWSAELPDDFQPKQKEVRSPKFHEFCAKAKVIPGCRELEGRHIGFFSEFPTEAGGMVQFKSGISFVSIEGARRNLEVEIPGWDFDTVRAQTRQAWATAIGKMEVDGGTPEQQRAFYTALYHTMIDPRAFADVDGTYTGGDGKPHKADRYVRRTIFSGWDVFRSQYPLLTLINTAAVNDTINSLVDLAKESGEGYLERWEFLNAYSGCMVGNPAVVVLSDAYAKGIRGYDVERAYTAARASCEKFGNGELGYSPGGLSTTLEFAHDEWCLSRLAEALGKKEDAQLYAKRAQSYRNNFDPEVGWFHPKDAKGQWTPWTEKGRLDTRGSVESNWGQQGWFVPHDVPGLIQLLGGPEKAVTQLNEFLEKTPDPSTWNDYYNHANEVVQLVPFLFNRMGAPWLTQKWVRFICEKAHSDQPDGLAGDDDVGQMSAWYVLCASGLHQACPGDTRYEIFTPLFDKVTLRVDPMYGTNRTFVVIAHGNGPGERYIQSATLNGKPIDRCWLDHKEIVAGGTLELKLGPAPNKNWGLENFPGSLR